MLTAGSHLAAYLQRISHVLEHDGPPPPLPEGEHDGLPIVALAKRAGLSRHEIDLIVAIAAPLLDVQVAAHLRERTAGNTPTVEEIVRALQSEHTDAAELLGALAADGALVALGLVLRSGPDTAPLQQLVRVDERVAAYLRGQPGIDRRLRGIAVPYPADRGGEVSGALVRALGTPGPVLVEGPRRVGKTTAVLAALASLGETGLVVDLERVAASPDPLALLAIARREAFLVAARLVLRVGDWSADGPGDLRREVLAIVQEGGAILVMQDATDPARELHGPRRIVVAMPSTAQQAAIWHQAVGGAVDVTEVSERYPLPPGEILAAAAAANAAAQLAGRAVTPSDLLAAARERLAHRLGDVAELVHTTLAWTDVVLPDDVADRVRELLDSVRCRAQVMDTWGFGTKLPYGRATTALFAGPPGTGKTMVATLIGKQLGLEVFRVDLSRIVSKFIGETEKNLARAFDEASRSRAILLFDEADSLFSKRTQVKSSNDRYANLEVNFLLQRLESHDGIVVLTTNAATSMDQAFVRRIRFRIDFAAPEPHERAALWRAMVPAAAPLAFDVDFDALGERFELTGGHIKNAVVRAAYAIAGAGETRLTQAALEQSALAEWTELGHLSAPAARGSSPDFEPPSEEPAPSPALPRVVERAVLDTLSAPLTGPTIERATAKREADLKQVFSTLTPHEASILRRRLELGDGADSIAAAFGRFTQERRMRLLAFLCDARRREATASPVSRGAS